MLRHEEISPCPLWLVVLSADDKACWASELSRENQRLWGKNLSLQRKLERTEARVDALSGVMDLMSLKSEEQTKCVAQLKASLDHLANEHVSVLETSVFFILGLLVKRFGGSDGESSPSNGSGERPSRSGGVVGSSGGSDVGGGSDEVFFARLFTDILTNPGCQSDSGTKSAPFPDSNRTLSPISISSSSSVPPLCSASTSAGSPSGSRPAAEDEADSRLPNVGVGSGDLCGGECSGR